MIVIYCDRCHSVCPTYQVFPSPFASGNLYLCETGRSDGGSCLNDFQTFMKGTSTTAITVLPTVSAQAASPVL